MQIIYVEMSNIIEDFHPMKINISKDIKIVRKNGNCYFQLLLIIILYDYIYMIIYDIHII